MADTYMVVNGAAPGAAAPVAVTTGTAIKTLIQLATASTRTLRVIEWGISFDGSAAATPIKVELLRTTGAATVTAYGAGDITKFGDPNAPASLVQLGTALSGYTASAEGTPGTSVAFFADFVPPTGSVFVQYPLGREPEIPVSAFLRLRVTAGAAVNAYAHIVWEE